MYICMMYASKTYGNKYVCDIVISLTSPRFFYIYLQKKVYVGCKQRIWVRYDKNLTSFFFEGIEIEVEVE
jgi:hypothetical protein